VKIFFCGSGFLFPERWVTESLKNRKNLLLPDLYKIKRNKWQWVKSADLSADFKPGKSERIDIIIEKHKKTNQSPGRDDIISGSDTKSPLILYNTGSFFRGSVCAENRSS